MRASARTFLVAVVGVFLIGCNKRTSASADSALPGGGAFDADAARAQIIAADSAWVRAVQSKNVDSLMPYYATDAVSMSEGTKAADGTDAIRAAYVKMVATNPRNMSLKVDAVTFSDDGTMASDYGSFGGTADGPGGKPIKFTGNYVNVWQRVNGRWVLIAEISNSAPTS
jgi:ketosteroid isomerase-like protein